MLVIIAIGIWPMLIAPLGRVYVALCARYLSDAPIGHHYPPLAVAFLAPISGMLAGGFVRALTRQLWRQRRLATNVARHRDDASNPCGQLVHDLGLTRRVVNTGDPAAYASCGGLFRAQVCLHRGLIDLLTAAELEAVLGHERHHLRHYDPLRYSVAELLDRLVPLLPAIHTLTNRMRIRAELAAHRAALRYTSTEQLASALIKVMRAGAPVGPHAVIAALSPTDTRVAVLLDQSVAMPFDRRDVVVSLGVALIAAAVLGWFGLAPVWWTARH